MKITEDNRYIIGVDAGYHMLKTSTSVMENGVYHMGDNEPTHKRNTLEMEGRYFKVGENRTTLSEDKVSTENDLLLTMAGIAMELRRVGVNEANVILAVGLPYSYYGRCKMETKDYYEKNTCLRFYYEEEFYRVKIDKVFVFPQGYSAVAPRISNMQGEYLVVDVGGKTTDVVMIRDGFPLESESVTIENAMVKIMSSAHRELQITFGKDVPERKIMEYILGKDTLLSSDEKRKIDEVIGDEMSSLVAKLKELRYNTDYTNIIFVGGGATVAEKFLPEIKKNYIFDRDICANAKGYEFLAEKMIIRGKNV